MRKSVAVWGVAAVLLVGLTGCFQNPLESLVEDAVGGAVENAVENELEQELGEGAEVDFSGDVALPSDWPAEIPVPDGEIFSAMSLDGTHTIVVNVASAAVADETLQALLASGYNIVFEQSVEGMQAYSLDNGQWSVQYQVMDDGETISVFMSVGPTVQ